MRQVDKTGFARYQYAPNPKNSKHLLNSAANTAGSWKLTILFRKSYYLLVIQRRGKECLDSYSAFY